MSEAKRMLLGLFRSQSRSENKPQDFKTGKLGSKQFHTPKSYELKNANAKERAGDTKEPSPISASDQTDQIRNIEAFSPVPGKWPPEGFNSDDFLQQEQALNLISRGVPRYQGFRQSIPHASEDYFALYASCDGIWGGDDGTSFYSPAFAAMTFQLHSPGIADQPWNTLEQPSLAFCYGERPGTVTLNHWASLSGRLRPTVRLRDPEIRPRDMDLASILDRLINLERGFEEENEGLMYKNLYGSLLRDPDKYFNPHKAMEKQIADLIVVLSGPQWIDFSNPRNQIVAKFFSNIDYSEGGSKRFFHQLLLSMELDIRIHSSSHADSPKRKLLSQLPPCIAWDLAVSRKWRECIRIEKYRAENGSNQVRLRLRIKKRQVKALRKFARAMKWPNLAEVNQVLRSKDSGAKQLEERGSDAMSYFSGVVLPGSTLPFLLMNSLISCDEDQNKGHWTTLPYNYHQCGFQYKSTTYWTSTCIVGKVLAPSCREIAGWIGPAMSAPDLDRVQVVRIRQRQPRKITPEDVQSMNIRSDPLGPVPSTKVYPITEYELILPDLEGIPDTIRIEKLALAPVLGRDFPDGNSDPDPLLFDACIQFAIDGISWPLRLAFDVSYVAACPCIGGPHPLFYDYVYKAVKIDELLTIKDWGSLAENTKFGINNKGTENLELAKDDLDGEKVLVVEAFGVLDNEVLARAWASHWGLSAVVANIQKTCMACAIREAYAACVNVVILVEGLRNRHDSEN